MRIIHDSGEIWLREVDLARALGMEDFANQNIEKSVDKKHCTAYEAMSSLSRIHPNTTFINETDMNLLIICSRKPKAADFAEWVCSEVLSSIRKTARYEIENPDLNPNKKLNEYLERAVEKQDKEMEQFENYNMAKKFLQYEIIMYTVQQQ